MILPTRRFHRSFKPSAIGRSPKGRGARRPEELAKLCFRAVEALVGPSRFRLRSGCWHQGPENTSCSFFGPGSFFRRSSFPDMCLKTCRGLGRKEGFRRRQFWMAQEEFAISALRELSRAGPEKFHAEAGQVDCGPAVESCKATNRLGAAGPGGARSGFRGAKVG